MKKVLDELYAFKAKFQKEITELELKKSCPTTNDYDGGRADGKIEGRLEAKKWALVQLDQIIHNLLKP